MSSMYDEIESKSMYVETISAWSNIFNCVFIKTKGAMSRLRLSLW
jgi:hypothetical protein